MRGGITLWKDRGYEVDVPRAFTPEQRDRYSRHLLVPEIGEEGQRKLLDARVLLLGAGGLGSPTALYLAAAGVGTIGIVDNDVVDLSNLQRQVIHNTKRIGVPKVDSAEETITALNPDVKVVKYPVRLDASNIMEIIEGWDVIVDGLDNFPTRYLLNDASVRLQIPVVSASILGFDGQLSVFKPYEGPCYRCLFREPPPAEMAPSCGANGVLGVLPGTMGLLQATEVIKLIVGAGEARDRPAAALRRARRDADGGQDQARSGLPDLLARPRVDHRRGDGRVPRLRGVLRRGRIGSPARWRRSESHPCCARRSAASARSRAAGASVGEVLAGLIAAHPGDADAALRRRRRAQPLRQRLSQRRGRARARRAATPRSARPTCSSSSRRWPAAPERLPGVAILIGGP